jgi:hypothetical protein
MMRARRVGDGGVIAVLFAIVLVVVGAFMALALNVGMLMTNKGQLQNASDSSALAAAGSIDGTSNSLIGANCTAGLAAGAYSDAHLVAGASVAINPSCGGDDVVFGRWDFTTAAFTAQQPVTDTLAVNAVRVINGQDKDIHSSHNSTFSVDFFANWLGAQKVNVGTGAVAVGRGARAACPMPFVLPSCLLDPNNGTAFQCNPGTTMQLRLSNNNNDNTGFIFFPGSHDTGNEGAREAILTRCSLPIADTTPQGTSKNGNDLNNSIIQALLGLDKNLERQPPLAGNNSSSLCVFNGPNSFPIGRMTCPPSFNASKPVDIDQFALVRITRITDQNGTIFNFCPTSDPKNWNTFTSGLPQDKANPKTIDVQMTCSGSGLSYDTSVNLRLVK